MSIAPITLEDHLAGNANAPVTLLEYGDFQCPDCGTGFEIVRRLQKHFGPNRLRFAFRNFPLPMHPNARPAAEAAEFAATHNQYWEMHHLLFEHQRALGTDHLLDYARQLGLPAQDLESALKQETFTERVERDLHSGKAGGVHATPTFYINGKKLEGAYDYDALLDKIEQAAQA